VPETDKTPELESNTVTKGKLATILLRSLSFSAEAFAGSRGRIEHAVAFVLLSTLLFLPAMGKVSFSITWYQRGFFVISNENHPGNRMKRVGRD
jgi:hypothetical protein